VIRGVAWLIALLILAPVLFWQLVQPRNTLEPLPLLYTLSGDFTLDSTLGNRLTLSDLRGQLVLLNFGYTGCPDVCPTALARMRDALNMLEDGKNRVQPLFVTLDPELDTVDRIRPYVQFFDPGFIGLSGTPIEIAEAAAGYKVYFEKQIEAGTNPLSSGYSISHSSHIYLLDGSGQVRATFGEGVPVETIAGAMQQLLEQPQTVARSMSYDA
jgi:protein SCO1/2